MPIVLLRAHALVISESCAGVARGWRMVEESNALSASGEIDPHDQPRMKGNFGRAWDGLLLVITHSAALSRTFFPIVPRRIKRESNQSHAKRSDDREARGQQLRSWLGVQPDSPLNMAGREARDTIEHWDEKVDDWYHDAVTAKAVDPTQYHGRSYNHPQRTVTYGRKSLDLTLLLREVDRVRLAYALVAEDLSDLTDRRAYVAL